MRAFTTPTLRMTVMKKVGYDEHGLPIFEPATDLVFDYLIFTIKCLGKRIDKNVPFSDYTEEAKFTVRYSQEDTSVLKGIAEAEINFMRGETRIGSCIQYIDIEKNLINEVITNG